jgi:acetolactate synthase-1/2/3 large subunit
VAFVGDAGLEMSLGELATARRLGRQVIVIVLVDQSLGLIELKQRTSGLPNLGVDFDGTDFAAVATALGGGGATVSSRDDLGKALTIALSHPGFSVIACMIGPRAYDGLF